MTQQQQHRNTKNPDTSLIVLFPPPGHCRSGYRTHLDATVGMSFRTEEESSVDQRVSVEHEHWLLAQDTRDPALLLGSQRGKNEQASLVVSVVAFVFDLEIEERVVGYFRCIYLDVVRDPPPKGLLINGSRLGRTYWLFMH